jgi:CBS domain-containing protein
MKTIHQLLQSKGGPTLSVPSSSTVYDALVIMAEKHIGALLVIDDGKLTGIFSERDYARGIVLKGKSSKNTPVSDIMTPRSLLITVTPDYTVDECLNLVSNKRIRHLPVMEGEKVVGILSIGDLVKEVIEHQQFLINQLENYIKS